MEQINRQLNGHLIAISHDRGTGIVAIKYRTSNAKGEVKIPAWEFGDQIPKRGDGAMMIEYKGADAVGLRIGGTLVLRRPGFSGDVTIPLTRLSEGTLSRIPSPPDFRQSEPSPTSVAPDAAAYGRRSRNQMSRSPA